MELFNKALFLSQQKIFALTHWRVYTLMVYLFQILNQFVLLFRKNFIEKSSTIWRVLPLVRVDTRVSEMRVLVLTSGGARQFMKLFSITFCKIRKTIQRFFVPQFLPNESFCVIN
jgi:hypothetical protein